MDVAEATVRSLLTLARRRLRTLLGARRAGRRAVRTSDARDRRRAGRAAARLRGAAGARSRRASWAPRTRHAPRGRLAGRGAGARRRRATARRRRRATPAVAWPPRWPRRGPSRWPLLGGRAARAAGRARASRACCVGPASRPAPAARHGRPPPAPPRPGSWPSADDHLELRSGPGPPAPFPDNHPPPERNPDECAASPAVLSLLRAFAQPAGLPDARRAHGPARGPGLRGRPARARVPRRCPRAWTRTCCSCARCACTEREIIVRNARRLVRGPLAQLPGLRLGHAAVYDTADYVKSVKSLAGPLAAGRRRTTDELAAHRRLRAALRGRRRRLVQPARAAAARSCATLRARGWSEIAEHHRFQCQPGDDRDERHARAGDAHAGPAGAHRPGAAPDAGHVLAGARLVRAQEPHGAAAGAASRTCRQLLPFALRRR